MGHIFFRAIKYQLYLLQLENYELTRFFKLLFKKGFWPKGEQRKELVWTMKALLIFGLAEVLILGLSSVFAYWIFLNVLENTAATVVMLIAIFFILQILGFLFLSISVILLSPVDWLVKSVIIVRAKSKMKSLDKLKIIGVAGSYGKTTMKEVLKQVLGSRFKVQATPESVNTPVGIARWALKNVGLFSPSPQPSPTRGEGDYNEIAIVEMGEHYRGDVEEICNIAKPDIAVVTGIDEAHLERMQTMENIIDTIFEIVSKAKPGALVVLNGDDKNVVDHFKEYVWPDHKLAVYGQQNQESRIKNQGFNTEKLGWDAEVEGVGKIFINLLGEYGLGDVDAAIKIAKSLGMSNEDIKRGIANIKPVPHRLQPIRSAGNILVIDDSYNGNSEGVKEAIKVLSRFANRRKIFITPGLVETGKAIIDVHKEIGRQLATVADVVILIRNSVSGYIESGIKNQELRMGVKKPEIIIFDSATEAHAALGKILKPNDVIVFQNDWGDQYI